MKFLLQAILLSLTFIFHMGVQAQFVLGPENFMYGKETPGAYAKSHHKIEFIHQDKIIVSYHYTYENQSYNRRYYAFDKTTGLLSSVLEVRSALIKGVTTGKVGDFRLHKSSSGIFVFFETVETISETEKLGKMWVAGLNDNFEMITEAHELFSYPAYVKVNGYFTNMEYPLEEYLKFNSDGNEAYLYSANENGMVLNIVHFPQMDHQPLELNSDILSEEQVSVDGDPGGFIEDQAYVSTYTQHTKESEEDSLGAMFSSQGAAGLFLADLSSAVSNSLKGDLIPFPTDWGFYPMKYKIVGNKLYCFGTSGQIESYTWEEIRLMMDQKGQNRGVETYFGAVYDLNDKTRPMSISQFEIPDSLIRAVVSASEEKAMKKMGLSLDNYFFSFQVLDLVGLTDGGFLVVTEIVQESFFDESSTQRIKNLLIFEFDAAGKFKRMVNYSKNVVLKKDFSSLNSRYIQNEDELLFFTHMPLEGDFNEKPLENASVCVISYDLTGNFKKELITDFDGGKGRLVADVVKEGNTYYLLMTGTNDKYLRIGKYTR